MKKYIGGFLELELFGHPDSGYHAAALALNNARACVSHLIRRTQMQSVWLPYYTCDALVEPFRVAGISYRFYDLNEQFEPLNLPVLGSGEYMVYINYFGLKTAFVTQLIARYGEYLLIDDTQNYFARGYSNGWSFNSARKWFGVPDGGYLYGPADKLGTATGYPTNTMYHVQHLVDRLRGQQQAAYEAFVQYEEELTSIPYQISSLSDSLLSQVDYHAIATQRRENYLQYHAVLGDLNRLSLPLGLGELSAEAVPFCYPFVPFTGKVADRNTLFAQNIFVPKLWPDVLNRQTGGYEWERQTTQALLPLPIDHRYGSVEVDYVVQATCELIAKTK